MNDRLRKSQPKEKLKRKKYEQFYNNNSHKTQFKTPALD